MPAENDPSEPEALRRGLRELFDKAPPVPPEVERVILEQARSRLAEALEPGRPHGLNPFLLRVLPIAASLLFVVALGIYWVKRRSPIDRQETTAQATRPADLDENGRVDVLDAFLLARHIDAGSALEADWDLSGDGRVDAADVDLVAFAAVELGS